MLNGPRPTRIEQVDWHSILPWLRLWDNFAIAKRPTHLLLALLMLICVLATVLALDAVFDRQAKVGAIRIHSNPQLQAAADALHDVRGIDVRHEVLTLEHQRLLLEAINEATRSGDYEAAAQWQELMRVGLEQPRSIFFASLRFETDSVQRLMAAVFSGNWQLSKLITPGSPDRSSVAGVLTDWYHLTHWWITQHLWPMLVYSLLAFVLWVVLGGMLHRSVAVQAVQGLRLPIAASFAFMGPRLGRLALAPLIPGLIMAVLALVIVLVGWLLSIGGLDVVGGLLMPLAILAAFVLAAVVVLYLGVVHLIYPAIAVDDTDTFDAVSRSFHYVLTRPWRMVFYGLVAALHGLTTFAFVGVIVWLALTLLRALMLMWFGDAATLTNAEMGAAGLASLLPEPEFLHFYYWPDLSGLSGTRLFAANMVGLCGSFLTLMLWAFAMSYYVTACTQIYLLLRQASDLVDPSVLDGGVWEAPAAQDGDDGNHGEEHE